MPFWTEPHLATWPGNASRPEWIFERQLGGERCLAFADPAGIRLMSRRRHDLTRTFPEIAVALSAPPRDDGLIVFDGAVEALRTASAAARRRQPGL